MARKSSFDEEQLTDSSYYILLTLVEEKHGYSVMQNIEELADGELKMNHSRKKFKFSMWLGLTVMYMVYALFMKFKKNKI